MSILYLDFETRSTVDLRKSGAEVYARDPSTDLLCMAFAFDEEPVDLIEYGERIPDRVFDHILNDEMVVAHNAHFELAIWNNCCAPKYDWPLLSPNQTYCSMAMAYAMALPGSLENASHAVGIDKEKDMAGNRVMLQISKPREVLEDGSVVWWDDREKFERVFAYCKQDIEVQRDLYKRLLPLSVSERELWLLDYQINQRGVRIDLPAVHVALKLVEKEQERLDLEMRGVTENQVSMCTAAGQLREWLNWRGIATESVDKSNVLAMLARVDLPPDCRKALLLRQEAAKSSTAKLEAMRLRACADGRVRGTKQYHGASTGRWAGRGLQTDNFPRPKLSQEDIDGVFKILSEVS